MYNAGKIEKKWQKYWEDNKINQVDLDKVKNPFYNLMMFPYPSGEGLHVGNMFAFVHSDAYGRFMRLKSFDVFEPIGLDGFGIHSENYAIKINEHILDISERTEKHFYGQLRLIGNQYDWARNLETYKPEYYKWTQWIFVQMFKKGLAYQAESYVNWCPSCKTVLSDEQVVSDRCERCDNFVEKKLMKQWFFRITDYAERLLKNLDWINWSDRTKIAQKNWIGKSKGAQFEMKVVDADEKINVFTTRIDTVFGMTFALVAPEHELMQKLKPQITNWFEVEKYIARTKKKSELQRISEIKEKTGVELKGVKVINPFTKRAIPLFASDFVLGHYGTGAIMAVPGHDQRDYDFAKKFNLPIVEAIKPKGEAVEDTKLSKAYVEDGILVNSNEYNGLTSEEARKRLTQWLEKEKIGHGTVNYKLRDWCISRQRYWGPPIPMVHCEKCGAVPVPENELPVLLPKTKDYLPRSDGLSPLARNEKFWKTKCPKCSGSARRETDVSDTFLDSAWYFFRYPSVEFNDKIFDKERTKKWLPVDMYIGGQEHAVLHLLYSRFITMFFHDLGLIDFEEPYKRFFAHGLLIKEGTKMSKSKGNAINPDEYIQKYGADSVRMYLMFMGEVTQGGDWRDAGMAGMFRFINRVWNIAEKIIKKGNKKSQDADVLKIMHKTIKRVGDDLEKLKFNTSIASIMEYVNSLYEFETAKKGIGVDTVEVLAKLLAPFAPHLAEELWSKLGNKKSIHLETWPKYDLKFIETGEYELVIQINGKMRDKVKVSKKLERPEIEKLVLSREIVKKYIGTNAIKKVIFVPNRLINIVI